MNIFTPREAIELLCASFRLYIEDKLREIAKDAKELMEFVKERL